jgi:hypothetical protein
MRLYLIDHTTDDGHDYDLLVWAFTPSQAAGFWLAHYGFVEEDEPTAPDRIFCVPIFPVPTRPAAIPWHSPGGVIEVTV